MNEPPPKPQEEEWEDPHPKKKSHPEQNWLLGTFLVIVLYILSIGPATLLYSRRAISLKAYAITYRPLVALARKVPPVERAIDWYVGLWGKF
jgi:hypothetical protein